MSSRGADQEPAPEDIGKHRSQKPANLETERHRGPGHRGPHTTDELRRCDKRRSLLSKVTFRARALLTSPRRLLRTSQPGDLKIPLETTGGARHLPHVGRDAALSSQSKIKQRQTLK